MNAVSMQNVLAKKKETANECWTQLTSCDGAVPMHYKLNERRILIQWFVETSFQVGVHQFIVCRKVLNQGPPLARDPILKL